MIIGSLIPLKFKGSPIIGKIIINKHCIVGANSVVLPNVTFNEGTALGALSLANKDLEEYKVYAGVPAKLIKARNKLNILKLEQQLNDKN